jgi:predicted HicB family RNase H-like nuclease
MKCGYNHEAPEEYQCGITAMKGESLCSYHYAYWAQKEIKKLNKFSEMAMRRFASLEEALTPSPDTKTEYSGEFKFHIDESSETGEPYSRAVTVPWTTIKDIMKMIRKRATENP